MKKFLLLSLLFLFSSISQKLFAQLDMETLDSSSYELPLQVLVDSCLKTLNFDHIPHGLLIDKAFQTTDVSYFHGALADSNVLNLYTWRYTYGTLYRAFLDSTEAFDSLPIPTGVMQSYLDSGQMPVAVLNYQYGAIKPNAFDEGWIYYNGVQLMEDTSAAESPFESKNCFAASSGAMHSDTNVVQFILPTSLYVSNDARTVAHIFLDAADGQGYQEVYFDETNIITYANVGDTTVVVKLKIQMDDESQLFSHFALTVAGTATGGGSGFYNQAVDDYFEKTATKSYGSGTYAYGKARVSVRYGCGHTQLVKPFIIVEGFDDPLVATAYPTARKNGQNFITSQIKEVDPNIYHNLYNQGYDIVYVDLERGFDYIQRSAFALEAVINEVNTRKANANSTHQNVVMGISMGGLVAKYALADMNSHSENHDSRLFVSLDSPLRGANVPLGMQALSAHLWEAYSSGSKLSTVEQVAALSDFMSLECEAAKQMLIYHYNPTYANVHSTFQAELDALGSVGCKMIAISNGSSAGIRQKLSNNSTAMSPSDLMVQNKFGTIAIWAAPDNPVSKTVVYAASFGILKFKKSRVLKVKGTDPIDCAQGGTGATNNGNMLAIKLIGTTFYCPNYCFIPTVSALNASISIDANINNNPSLISALHQYESADHTNCTISPLPSVGSSFNQNHARLNARNITALLTALTEVPSSIETSEIYNFGGPTTDRLGTIEVKSGAILSVNKNEKVELTQPPATNPNNPPVDNSNFRVETYNTSCISIAPIVTIKSNGILQLGDASTARTGELIITNGSTLILEGGSDLKIYGNSKLIIEEGATLRVHQYANILLDAGTTNLIIKGTLDLEDNTNFSFSGDGFVSFSCPDNSYCNITSGNNCTIDLEGTNRNSDKILDVKGKGLNLSGLSEFKLKSGYVELGTNTELVIEKDLHLENVYVTRPVANTNNYVYKGFVLQNQPSTGTVFIEDCLFEHATTAIKFTKATSGITQLAMSNTAFFACSLGVHTTGSSFLFSLLRFENCEQGWVADNVQDLSDFKGYMENVDYGITYDGNQGADLYVYESTFTGCTEAMDVMGDMVLTSRCSHYVANTNDIIKDQTDLNISDDVYFSRADPLNSVGNGGYNLFNNTTGNTIYVSGLTHLYAYKGYNEFIYSSNPMHVFDGEFNNVPSPHVRLEDNYWSLYNGGTQVYDLASASSGMWSVDDMYSSTAYYNTITTWSTHSTCTNAWDGEIVIEGMAKDNTSTATKEIATTKNTFVIYPNPTDKLLHVQCTTQNSNYTLKAIDMTGRIIYLQPTSRGNNTQSFDVSNLAAGLYQILIEQNGVTLAKQKVVVRR
ncbi:MAG: T9SS type A sorting domain-containing protein [Bacteroidia bacterium]|nr:T9SS type A sorting domain-containing protein [Bacteroidia bacterium]